MMKVRMSGFAIVVALLSGLIGAATTHGRELRPLTARELRQTTAGTLYYCAIKTGGFVPDTGCGQCKYIGVVNVFYDIFDGDGNLIGIDSIPQAVWQNCVNNAGNDACYRDDYPMEAGSTPTCEKTEVTCGGDGTFFAGAGCANQIPQASVNGSPDLGSYCRSWRLHAINGTAPGVNCTGEPSGQF